MAQESPRVRPVQLHVIHDLGGGSAKWLADYCKADTTRTNLVLRPLAHDHAMGSGLALYDDPSGDVPLKVWKFAEKIGATVTEHAEYRAALGEIVAGYGVQAVVVSSLIGHSLDALDTGLPTVVVCHDYFPWCPMINLYSDGVRDDAEEDPFAGFDADAHIAVRKRFVELVHRPHVRVAAPSESVGRNLRRLDPRFSDLDLAVVPHGYGEPLPHVELGAMPPDERLRVLVLGQLSNAKGLELLRSALGQLTRFADVYLLGCREAGEYFTFQRHVHVTSYYELRELPGHIASIRPHVALVTSVVEETFGYALSELFMLGVPVAATRVGAFADRIRDGENGWLYAPDPAALLATLRAIDTGRADLDRVRAGLAGFRHRTAGEMVSDYHRLAPIEPRPAPTPPPVPAAARADAVDAVTVASMWKQVRAMHLQLSVSADARQRMEMQLRALEERIADLSREIATREALLVQKDLQLQDVASQGAKLAEIYASTSWRVSRPVRWIGTNFPAMRATLRGLLPRSWKRERPAPGGMQPDERDLAAWPQYRAAFAREVGPRLVARLGALARQPLISVIVPVYDPDEGMLRQMLDSVRAQIYPCWELCVVDDASSAPHVAAALAEYAKRDARIRVERNERNRGVSHASNRALAMATGEYVVLLDHDDLLEEQALFRVAESIVQDDPCMVYSDEVLVTPDGDTVTRYAYRPAFSPEHLRSHPYIVHLVGFKASLLREVGGWDEQLRISQDYDLILRATERARRIAHIPEILYRWRIHGGSSGIARQAEVVETSKAILRRHLERCGVDGFVEDGASFNFYSVRYPLAAGLRVAIVIPTKNHAELLRQCIASIRATVVGVPYDIVVVDHESDDPATLAYLASISGQARVQRYQGPFNFAAMNNLAVAGLGGAYTHYLLCNNDVEAHERGWLERMLELGQQPDAGIVGATLFYPDRKTIQHAGVCVGMFRGAEHYGKFMRYPEDAHRAGGELLGMNHEVAAVTAACMLVRKETWDDIAGFDESIAVGFGDVDFCLRALQKGWRVLFCARARLVHHESMTRGVSEVDAHPVDTSLFRVKWRELLDAGDPFYNRGLSLSSTRWEIRRPLPCSARIVRRVVERDRAAARERVTFSASRLLEEPEAAQRQAQPPA